MSPRLGSGSLASIMHLLSVLPWPGGTIGAYLVQNGVTTLASVILTFPAPGNYIIQATGTATHNGASIRHSLTALAIPVS